MIKKQSLELDSHCDSIKVVIPPDNFDPIFYPLMLIWLQLIILTALVALAAKL